MHGSALRSYLFLSWWQSAENQYCRLAKENFSLNLIQKKMRGALPSLLHADPSQILGVSAQGEPAGQGAWTEGRVKGGETLAKSQVQLLLPCLSPQTRELWKQDSHLFSKGIRDPSSLFSSLMLQSHLQLHIPDAGQRTEQSGSQNYTRLKCNPSFYFSLSIRISGCSKAALLL